MYENSPNDPHPIGHEHASVGAHAHEILRSYLEDAALQQQVEAADQELASPNLVRVHNALESGSGVSGEDGIDKQDTTRYYDALVKKRGAEAGKVELDATDPDAQALIEALQEINIEHMIGEGENNPDAPFGGYKENLAESWRVVSAETVKEWLDQRSIVDTSRIASGKRTVTVKGGGETQFAVPVDTVVNLAGFDSWHGRREHEKSWSSAYGSGEMASIDVIKHYAGLSTEIPPVSHMRMFVQPDGKVFSDNAAGDSHRIAAAVLRGQQSVQANKVTFVMLEENILE